LRSWVLNLRGHLAVMAPRGSLRHGSAFNVSFQAPSFTRQHSFNTNHVYTFNIPHNFLIGELYLFLVSLLPSDTHPSKDANLVKGQTARLQQETPSRQAEGTHPPRHTPPILHHLQHADPFTHSTTGAFCSLALRNTYTTPLHFPLLTRSHIPSLRNADTWLGKRVQAEIHGFPTGLADLGRILVYIEACSTPCISGIDVHGRFLEFLSLLFSYED
jgi:hypothetical protein